MKITQLLFALLLCALNANTAWADRGHRHRHHSHSGVHLDLRLNPFLWPAYPYRYYSPPRYYAPYVYESPVVVERPVYIEQPSANLNPPSAPPVNYWYYCASARGYYPYIQECPNGWQKVLPQPMDAP